MVTEMKGLRVPATNCDKYPSPPLRRAALCLARTSSSPLTLDRCGGASLVRRSFGHAARDRRRSRGRGGSAAPVRAAATCTAVAICCRPRPPPRPPSFFQFHQSQSPPAVALHHGPPPRPSTGSVTPTRATRPRRSLASTLITNRNQLVASLRHRDLHIFDIQIRVEENQYWQTEDGTHCQPINARSLLQRRGVRGS